VLGRSELSMATIKHFYTFSCFGDVNRDRGT
jgi:hypothetical protein